MAPHIPQQQALHWMAALTRLFSLLITALCLFYRAHGHLPSLRERERRGGGGGGGGVNTTSTLSVNFFLNITELDLFFSFLLIIILEVSLTPQLI